MSILGPLDSKHIQFKDFFTIKVIAMQVVLYLNNEYRIIETSFVSLMSKHLIK